jgi:hypothetical protein
MPICCFRYETEALRWAIVVHVLALLWAVAAEVYQKASGYLVRRKPVRDAPYGASSLEGAVGLGGRERPAPFESVCRRPARFKEFCCSLAAG